MRFKIFGRIVVTARVSLRLKVNRTHDRDVAYYPVIRLDERRAGAGSTFAVTIPYVHAIDALRYSLQGNDPIHSKALRAWRGLS